MPQGTGLLGSCRGDSRWTALTAGTVAGVASLNIHGLGEYSAIPYHLPSRESLSHTSGNKANHAKDHPPQEARTSGGVFCKKESSDAQFKHAKERMNQEKLREPRSNLLAQVAYETFDDGVHSQKLIGLQVKRRTVGPSDPFPFFYD